MKKYYVVTYEKADGVFCCNLVYAGSEVQVREYYAKHPFVHVQTAMEHNIKEAREKHMSIIELGL